MTGEHVSRADECIACERMVPQRDDLGLCLDCAAKLDRDMIRDRDWERSWTAWYTPEDQREALRTHVVAHYGARYELIVPPAPQRRRHEQSCGGGRRI